MILEWKGECRLEGDRHHFAARPALSAAKVKMKWWTDLMKLKLVMTTSATSIPAWPSLRARRIPNFGLFTLNIAQCTCGSWRIVCGRRR